jgi:Phage integrase, N-terminal SAM-like domain
MSEPALTYPISTIPSSMGELVSLRSESLAQTTPWRRVLDVYLDTLDSPHTRRSYERHAAAALEALGVATLAELTGEQLAAWRAHVTSSELALGSQAQALAALRSFLKWSRLFGAHTLPKDMIGELLKTPGGSVQKPYQVLSEPEAVRLLEAAAGRVRRARPRRQGAQGPAGADSRRRRRRRPPLPGRERAHARLVGPAPAERGPGQAAPGPAHVDEGGRLPARAPLRAGGDRREEDQPALAAGTRPRCARSGPACRCRACGSSSGTRTWRRRRATSTTSSPPSCARRCRNCPHKRAQRPPRGVRAPPRIAL